MKRSTLTFIILAAGLFTASLLVVSCNGKHKQEEHEATMKDSTKQIVYACSMHPEVTGKEGDTCSKCGMKLEAVKGTDTTKHAH